MEVDAQPEAGPSTLSPPPPAPATNGASSVDATADASSAPAPVAPSPKAEGDEVKAEDGGEEAKVEEDAEMKEVEEELPEDASEVIYVNNLNEKIKLPVLKQSLRTLFRQYGKVLGVVAHSNVRMRGQAFITMNDKKVAAKAVKEVKGFPLYGKPMQLAFAKTKSDALVLAREPKAFDEHKAERLVRKKISRRDNPLRRKHLANKEAAAKAAETAAANGTAPVAPSASAARKLPQMPDEYLPPNKILFIQNLPDDTTKDSLEALFRPYPNLSEVRTIPGRKNIAFVEFGDEASSGVAREALHNTDLGEGDAAVKLKVTFAKQ